jgi:hypothetical protein
LTLELLKSPNQVHHTRNAQVFGGAGAGFYGDWAQWGRPPLRKNDAVNPRAIGNPKKCAQILRVFNAVKGKQQAGSARLRARPGLEQIFDCERLLRVDERDHTLMGGRLSHKRQLLARFLTDADAGLAALSHQLL